MTLTRDGRCIVTRMGALRLAPSVYGCSRGRYRSRADDRLAHRELELCTGPISRDEVFGNPRGLSIR